MKFAHDLRRFNEVNGYEDRAGVFVLFFGATMVLVLEPTPKQSGFSAFIRPGAVYMRYKTSMVASF